jgi:uncharacterized beta-barrel protein YwiB (DUF1934 family)
LESKCLVNLKTTTLSPGAEPLCYELTTSGKLSKLGSGGYRVRYDETSVEGVTFTNELVANGNNTAEIQRAGDFTTAFTLDTEKKHLCMVSTAFGDIHLGVMTHTIKNDLSQNGGELYLKYSLDANNNLISENEVRLSVRI